MTESFHKAAAASAAVAGIIASVALLLQEAGIPITGYHNPGPVGGFVAFCFVATLGGLLTNSWHKPLGIIIAFAVIVVQLTALVVSDSRASWLAAMAGTLILLISLGRIRIRRRVFWIAGICIVLAGVALYLYKPASANGRLLIWRVCLDMVADKPLFGFGLNGFTSNYMLYQAKYFRLHPDSTFVANAANIAYAYNEPLHIAVCFGLAGLSVVSYMICAFIFYPCRNNMERVVKAAYCSLLTFSLFSYPLSSPVLAGLMIGCPLMMGSRFDDNPSIRKILDGVLATFLVLVISWFVAQRCLMKKAQGLFSEDEAVVAECRHSLDKHYRMLICLFPDVVDVYGQYCTMKGDDIRITLDAAKIKPYVESYVSASDMIITDSSRVHDALEMYRTAGYMAPLRLLPKYHEFLYYYDTEHISKSDSLGRVILNLPMKIYSSDAILIRQDVKVKTCIIKIIPEE